MPVFPGPCGSSVVRDGDRRGHSDDDDFKSQVSEIAVSTPMHFPHPQSVTNIARNRNVCLARLGPLSMGCVHQQIRPPVIPAGASRRYISRLFRATFSDRWVLRRACDA
jgi:hypothetical protein